MITVKKQQKPVGILLYWLVVVLFAFQAIYTFASMNQIRLEEVMESIRGVYWFQNRQVWNGGYANLGWYTVLALTYNIFGFSVHTAKLVKLVIASMGIFCLTAILKRYLGVKLAILPLLIIGLSPTLIYFNSLQISHGIEVGYFLICLYIITKLDFKKPNWIQAKQAILWSIAMLAALSYPAFLYYLPIIAVFYLYILRKAEKDVLAKNIILSISFFLLPLILGIIYIKNRNLLFYDSETGLGLFRGNGRIAFDWSLFSGNIQMIFSDLFKSPVSYYFEIPRVEFSGIYPALTVIFVLTASVIFFFQTKKLRKLIIFIWFLLISYTIILNLLGPKGLGGLRRETILITLFYMLLVIVWRRIFEQKRCAMHLKFFCWVFYILLLIHHIIAFPINLEQAKKESRFKEEIWYTQGETAQKSLDGYLKEVRQKNLVLVCAADPTQQNSCQVGLIYTGVKGACIWNKLHCNEIDYFNPYNGQFTVLNDSYWPNHQEP